MTPLMNPAKGDGSRSYLLRTGSHTSALYRTDLTDHPFAIFQHARIEPFLDQPDHAPVRYPILEKLDQPIVPQRVEGTLHTLPISSTSQSTVHNIHLRVSLWPFSVTRIVRDSSN